MDGEIRVLHVDDDPEFLGLAQTLLERADDRLAVETAPGADEGLSRLADGRFHCVVSDYEMPGRDGIAFLEAVRERDEQLPFVLFTGRGSEAVASDAISAGVTDYLQKETGTDQFDVLANRITNAVAGDRARRQLDVLVDNLPGIVYQHRDEPEWLLTLIRGNCEELMGYTPEELASDVELAEQAIHPDDRQFHNETLREGLAEDGSYELTYRVLHADGSERWVLDSGQRHEAPFGDGNMFSGVLVDVEETKRYERELQTTKRRLDAILDHTATPLFVKAADGRYLLVNRGYRDLFDLDPDEAIGQTDETLHPPERAATLTATDEEVLESEETVESEDSFTVDGEERTFLVTKEPLYDVGTAADPDEPVGVFGVAQDVTE
ncbi:PAS domain S-box protein [Halobaculum sp. MBLA0147]|uniref:PAS domain-containing response regulator n=1 Tax=Halobaculum sp. MBLA0147 TaxID=3079934 RepID=UPI003523C8F6